ncbi:hypothetical protein NMU03_13875 [Allocoprobacillus halotolerans]|uniref:Aminoacyl-histidine dipeptidase n=1 Tax=Allocoprobacillus halotolerans TaxID=2944914 RepID=A0ABY5I3Z7_9FIRM|nr:hypothetical protein [Allocoprobacillus halotolerans]UTY38685.1 hypothetical protein NMU03_13875 [Allocoprobacillus halotolerans]
MKIDIIVAEIGGRNMTVLDTNKLIYRYFEEISQIPHGSYHEEKLADYIVDLAKKHHLRYQRDEMHNVIVFKEASKGYEDHEPVMLQAHIDMVNEKTKKATMILIMIHCNYMWKMVFYMHFKQL